MFGEISILAWMGGAIMFAIGGGAGFFISRQIKDKRTLELEEKLATARNELAGYRGDVNQHFLKTSLLLGKLTNNYREVYEHLATGAQKLCNENPATPKLDLPDTSILPAIEADDAIVDTVLSTATPAIESASESIIEEQQNEEQEAEQFQTEIPGEAADKEMPLSAESSTEQTTEHSVETKAEAPAPEDIPDNREEDEDVHLGAESAPSVDKEFHKTHQSIH